jgi:hypothetical protein
MSLEPLLIEHKVNLYLAGHDHDYERFKPVQGVQYIVSGGGGAYLRNFNKPLPHSLVRLKAHHFLDFELKGSQLKMQVVDDGRSEEFDSFMSFIETSSLYFSMMDVETGSYKIHLEPASFVEKTQIDPNAKTEYYIYYKFPKKYTNKVGRYEGEFVLKNTDGTLVFFKDPEQAKKSG